MPGHERRDEAAEHRGLFERQRVTAVEPDVHDSPRMRSSIASAIFSYLASVLPVTSATGIVSSAKRSHIGSITPAPSTRRQCAR